ncbi:cytochrome c [Porifericola rhodea]|uniref:c-type cytochrome n=1 Tax=Porifericola rhodea TaxID=930972 RepID=UPI0026665810|nr:cytochrome c [Porifericola rhodea]WKN31288.1 cytochrome c [Porifericola rhodea]
MISDTKSLDRGISAKAYFYIFISFVLFSLLPFNGQAEQTQDTTANTSGSTADQIPDDEQSIAHGRALFGQHCNVCHQVDKQIIGPALASVHATRPLDWLLRFIKNSQKVINDPEEKYAQQLYTQYNKQVMPAFEFLSDDDIISILAYIKSESISETVSGGVGGANQQSAVEPMGTTDVGPEDQNSEAYAQKERDAGYVNNPEMWNSSSITVLVIFGISLIAVVVAVIYFNKGRKRNKHKTNA